MRAGVAFSDDGKARAGMGVDAADFDNSGRSSVVVTNFDREMLALYRSSSDGSFADLAPRTNLGRDTLHSLGFGCFFFDVDLDGNLDLLVVNGHIDDVMQKVTDTPYAQQPHLFLERWQRRASRCGRWSWRRFRKSENWARRGLW